MIPVRPTGGRACWHASARQTRRSRSSSGLLAGPSLFSVHELRLNPDFDLIRSDPRYQVLLGRYAEP